MKRQKPFNLILLGDPAAGKATQVALIVKRYQMFDFDMGRELRRPMVRKTFDYDRSTAKGKLTPTKVVRAIFRAKRSRRADPSKGILFDGVPKMVGEARLLARQLKKSAGAIRSSSISYSARGIVSAQDQARQEGRHGRGAQEPHGILSARRRKDYSIFKDDLRV